MNPDQKRRATMRDKNRKISKSAGTVRLPEPRLTRVEQLSAAPRNARTHSPKQVRQIARSIEAFGFTSPVLVDGAGEVIAGHGRLAAAQILGMREVPTLCIDWLNPAQQRAYVLADNRLAEKAGYRSQHELVGVFKKGRRPHTNNVELGSNGRHRSNVWSYAGENTFKAGRAEELSWHPTVKPLDLVCDIIRDASDHGEIVLDGFGGSGTTLIAAEHCARTARLSTRTRPTLVAFTSRSILVLDSRFS